MSNEELVALIQAGDRDRIVELWQQVKRLVYKKAALWAGPGGTTIDDLGQAGFIAMLQAVNSYDASRGAKFSTYLGKCLWHEFLVATGWGTRRLQPDPLQDADSLDVPLRDGEDTTLVDFMPDPAAEAAMADVEDQDWNSRLSADLNLALSLLNEKERHTIRARYYQGQTLAEIAAADGVSRNAVFQQEQRAMRKLRRSSYFRKLRAYL